MFVQPYDEVNIKEIREIHFLYFKDEFEFPDFLNGYINAFIVRDDEDKIICLGGIRNIAETVVLTDKRLDVKTRRSGLLRLAQVLAFHADKAGHKQLHAFIEDPVWMKMLIKNGFRPTRGQALIVDIKD